MTETIVRVSLTPGGHRTQGLVSAPYSFPHTDHPGVRQLGAYTVSPFGTTQRRTPPSANSAVIAISATGTAPASRIGKL